MNLGIKVVAAGIVLALATAFSLIIPIALWPGEMKLVASYVCTNDQPDAMVVSDTTNVRPGETYTQFTMYCVGERGDYTDAGLRRPLTLLGVAHFGVLVLLVILRKLRRKRRARTNRVEPDPFMSPNTTETIATGPIIR